ncbi:hypothetical protein LOD99_8744 [Oopsacas minuta]|uniref:BZIP domain-containing protein n=1 Tax=Oopsacas minuta TaxID=111878 RepID=A0AAV7JFF7_9METZ|nr:hypothetical protein LOD99_8744 [Oopsacas minuta]
MNSKIKYTYYLWKIDLSIDQVVSFEWDRLAFRMLEKQLTISEKNFIKRFRKRERNRRKYQNEFDNLSSKVQTLQFEKKLLKLEREKLHEEIAYYEKHFSSIKPIIFY